MFKKFIFSGVLFLLPVLALAQAGGGPDAKFGPAGTIIGNVLSFINTYLVPGIFAIAFLVFIWGIFKYFIFGGANEADQEQGKQLMIYGIIGFVLMVSVWGIVEVVSKALNFNKGEAITTPKGPKI